jgi:hypothetical protein
MRRQHKTPNRRNKPPLRVNKLNLPLFMESPTIGNLLNLLSEAYLALSGEGSLLNKEILKDPKQYKVEVAAKVKAVLERHKIYPFN